MNWRSAREEVDDTLRGSNCIAHDLNFEQGGQMHQRASDRLLSGDRSEYSYDRGTTMCRTRETMCHRSRTLVRQIWHSN